MHVQLTLMSSITDCTEQKKKKIFIRLKKPGCQKTLRSTSADHPNIIFTDSYKLQNYILLLSILHTTRYYEDESKVTRAQCQIQREKTHTSMNNKKAELSQR